MSTTIQPSKALLVDCRSLQTRNGVTIIESCVQELTEDGLREQYFTFSLSPRFLAEFLERLRKEPALRSFVDGDSEEPGNVVALHRQTK